MSITAAVEASRAAPTHLSSFLDLENLRRRMAEGFISRKAHPAGPLFILNYTAMAQYTPGVMRDAEVRACRGLIVDADDNVVARPFAKFPNAGQCAPAGADAETAAAYDFGPLPEGEPFEVFEKADGSLGVLYHHDGEPAIATRGSFISEQAQWATRYYRKNLAGRVEIPEGQTYLFEIIYDENRIVCRYPFEGLVLLAVIDNATGADLALPTDWPGRVVRRFEFSCLEEVAAIAGTDPEGSEGAEGFVIVFASGARAKVKFGEYMRLHRLLTGVTSRVLWEYAAVDALAEKLEPVRIAKALKMNPATVADILAAPRRPLATLLEDVPDEFNTYVRTTVEGFAAAVAERVARAEAVFATLDPTWTRKEAAAAIAADPDRWLVFRLLDGQPCEDIAWKELRPAADTAFAVDDEG